MIWKIRNTALFLVVFLLPLIATAQERVSMPDVGMAPEGVSRPLIMVLVLAGMVLMPIIAMMTTSFVKLIVVVSMLRNALGTQQIPPTTVITGLCLILTVYIMSPVGVEMYQAAESTIKQGTNQPLLSQTSVNLLLEGVKEAREPMRAFLKKHTHPQEQKLFYSLGQVMMGLKGVEEVAAEEAAAAAEEAAVIAETGGVLPERTGKQPTLHPDDFLVLVPAFTISELTEAFQIAFIIFLPFLIIDLVVTNILLALGMFMVPPVTMSLPVKLLLFVMVDGWHILTKALVTGYM